jgi:hypothetical protein
MTWHRSQEIQKQPDGGAIEIKLQVYANQPSLLAGSV